VQSGRGRHVGVLDQAVVSNAKGDDGEFHAVPARSFSRAVEG
jgi:hypothetical protein